MTSATESRAARVALVLGSGGARGYAHIGVIAELRERGYDVVGISGSSMGALVGGLQAAGRLDDFAEWAKSLTQGAVLRLLDPSFTAAGVFRAEKILDVVRDMLGDIAIEDLPMPYTAVATDLIAGRSVWLQRGRVDTAIRASIAIPGVIAPHVVDGRLLADGGILDPLPMAPLSAVNADLTVAVSLNGGGPAAGGPTTEDADRGVSPGRLNRMLRGTWFSGADSDTGEGGEPEPEVPKLGSFEVMNRTIDIAQAALARHQLASHPPDLLIEVPRSSCRSLDFHRAAELVEVGRELAAQALDTAKSPPKAP
ncbi:patatin-like phospholipase family protein [[Mycobacterium] kokjensenii]|uniref:Patatin-like phospholipase family protein n=1 Tax=[Mycobacterium] kokjensenii TaxID=3064287 RepID=A0ABM9L8X7_9MYCO|nr:patatin-like phospholipase family protein [Mycolicibacter sp. MU0083]CAJ1494847.1 patatin-like phospholipase family protein [Mycolicibacter sp. MU0083]